MTLPLSRQSAAKDIIFTFGSSLTLLQLYSEPQIQKVKVILGHLVYRGVWTSGKLQQSFPNHLM